MGETLQPASKLEQKEKIDVGEGESDQATATRRTSVAQRKWKSGITGKGTRP